MTPTQLMHRYLDAARRKDMEAVTGYMADDLVVHIPGRSRFAGTHHGRHAAMDYITTIVGSLDEVAIEPVDSLASRDRFALLLTEELTLDGRTHRIRRANVYRVSDGRISEITIYEADQYEVDELVNDLRSRVSHPHHTTRSGTGPVGHSS